MHAIGWINNLKRRLKSGIRGVKSHGHGIYCKIPFTKIIGYILRPLPETGNINCNISPDHPGNALLMVQHHKSPPKFRGQNPGKTDRVHIHGNVQILCQTA